MTERASQRPKEVSVLVPVSERPGRLDVLYDEFAPALREAGYRFEFIFLVERRHQVLLDDVHRLEQRGEPVVLVQMGSAAGETALQRIGAETASYEVLVTLPAYMRIEASDLPKVIQPVIDGADMAVARRWPRRDSWLNRLQNRAFHVLVRQVAGKRLRDVACGVRATTRETFDALPLYGGFHRFLPLLALRAGYQVVEVDAAQHKADWQPRMYNPSVYVGRVLDVFGLFFLIRFTDKPLRFFGLLGVALSFLGTAVLAVLGVQRIQGEPLADRPLLLLGAVLLIIGFQAIALGLVGEIIVHVNAPTLRSYRLQEPPPSKPRAEEDEAPESSGSGLRAD